MISPMVSVSKATLTPRATQGFPPAKMAPAILKAKAWGLIPGLMGANATSVMVLCCVAGGGVGVAADAVVVVARATRARAAMKICAWRNLLMRAL